MKASAPSSPAAFGRVWRALAKCGLLLLADNRLPSVAGLVTGEPIRGSWWAHPKSHEIFRVASRLAEHRDVATAKLLARKVTFVHRSLWPALFAAATAGEAWPRSALSPAASWLLERVEEEGSVRMDEMARAGGLASRTAASSRQFLAAARELEFQLLVYAEQSHSDSGAHSKRLECWEHWARRVKLPRRCPPPGEALQQLELAAERLGGEKARRLLAWNRATGT